MFDATGDSFMYMHTSFIEETTTLLIEAVVQKKVGHKVETASAGFAFCNIFHISKDGSDAIPKQVMVQLGSPRMYGFITDIEQRNRVGKTMITYQFIREFRPFDALKELVP